MSMFLTDPEIDAMCEGLGPNSHAAKIKRLQSMGLIVNRKPNGRPLVVRSHAEAVLSGRAAASASEASLNGAQGQPPQEFKPDREAFILKFRRKAA